MQNVLVTGANSGIGLALCKLLVTQHGCHVFLGSRSAERGAAAMAAIVADHPDAAGKLEVIQLDVSSDASCASAAASLSARGVTLFALVNNAACGLAHADVGGTEGLLNTNFYGMRRRRRRHHHRRRVSAHSQARSGLRRQ